MLRAHSFNWLLFRRDLWYRGFLILGCSFWKEKIFIENTPSKHNQLCSRSLCIVVVILSWRCNGVVLALFQVPTFDRLYLDTLNNICCHICVYIWTSYFKFNLFFYLMLLHVSDAPSLCYAFRNAINIYTFTFDASSSKFGLPFMIATIRLGSISLNLSKVTSFSILLCQFRVFLIILHNSIKTAFSVIWSCNIDLHFFILKDLTNLVFYKLIFWNFNHPWENLVKITVKPV